MFSAANIKKMEDNKREGIKEAEMEYGLHIAITKIVRRLFVDR
ncbi:hypothetical protein RintRC_6295 [Richelia intracellularis]|nr:hypothetical protein RintRC_6295 [Richelia intracellularis]